MPLSAPARQLLADLAEKAGEGAEWVFPCRGASGHREDIKNEWAAVCAAAKISDARVHDLRHTYASVLASAGLSLPVIGALLGHTQQATTARYSHLFDDPLRAATERAGAMVTAPRKPEIAAVAIARDCAEDLSVASAQGSRSPSLAPTPRRTAEGIGDRSVA